MKKTEELTVISKTYDLIVWTVNHTSHFPRNHRHVLGTRIEQHLYDVLELLIEAKFSRQRRAQLESTNRKLETLPFLLRLANPHDVSLRDAEILARAVPATQVHQGLRPCQLYKMMKHRIIAAECLFMIL